MQRVNGYEGLGSPVPTVVAIGNFDGVHLGHREILKAALWKAKDQHLRSAVFTFWPHPQQVLRPESAQELLTLRHERAEIIESLGFDLLVEQPFDRSFSELTPEQFVHDVLRDRLGAQSIVVGYNFACGKGRTGNTDALLKICVRAGIEFTAIAPHEEGGMPISSSRIRSLLVRGEVAEAAKLLGHPFSYRGIVIHGDGRGNRIGIPTANLALPPKLKLANGVYATRVRVENDPHAISAVTNVGVRPTFHRADAMPFVETHLLEGSPALYGKTITVEFLSRIRDEKRFSGVDELKTQIARDIAEARKFLAGS